MKRNNLYTLAFAACALLLGACSNEWSTTDNPNHAGAGEAIVQVSLQFPQADKPGGYAEDNKPGNVPEGVALDAEKEIKSIAFIAFTAGGPGIYLSTNDALTDQGFTEPLTAVEGKKGAYTAKFKIKSNSFEGKTTIVAIANFFEHGLTFKTSEGNLLDLPALKAMLSDALVEGGSVNAPLLMTAANEITIVEGETVKFADARGTFNMERIMARVDVVNNAYDKDEANSDKNFKLISARLLNAPTHGTMIGGQTNANLTYVKTKSYTTIQEIAPANGEAVTPENPVKQQLEPMYVYENKNKDKDTDTQPGATATSIEVTGTYQGQTYTKNIPFMTAKTPANPTGTIVPIARNTRYVVEITRTTESKLEFGVKVTDWEEGEELNVGIDFAAPTLDGLEGFTPGAGAEWDAVTKTLNITKATAPAVLTFTVNGFQDTDFTLEKEYDENTTKVKDVIVVDREELSGYANEAPATPEVGPLHRKYTITIPKFTGEYPSNTKIIVYNSAYVDAKTEINVKYAPLFTGGFIKNDEAIAIDNNQKLIDLKGLSNGSTGTVSFFASSDSEVTITPPDHKGYTNDFYAIETVDVTDKDLTYYPKYGPCKRVNVAYKAISDNPEFATISVKDADATRKVLLSHFRKPIAIMKLPSNDNVLAEDSHKLYLAVNNGDHGSITYTVFEKEGSVTTLSPSVTYATNSTSPAWANGSKTASELLSDFGVVKQTVTLALPAAIKNPAAVTAYTIGFAGETPLELIPVYPSAYNTTNGTSGPIIAADKAFRPVLVKTVWWAPINIGQTKISKKDDPSSECGNLFQWGRKQALTWVSPQVVGPVAPTAPEVVQDMFITATSDWCNAPNNKFWNSGTDAAPIKVVANDPCPAGWRVPTKDEWANSIVGGDHGWQKATSPGAAQNGILTVTGEGSAKLYFPAAGLRYYDGSVNSQGTTGYYWASAEGGSSASYVYFDGASLSVFSLGRAAGLTVRCVQAL